MSVSDNIKQQIKSIRRRFLHDDYAGAAMKYIIIGEIAYQNLRAELMAEEEADALARNIDIYTAALWPEEFEDLLLVIDPLNKDREPLVVCDPIQEILMKVR